MFIATPRDYFASCHEMKRDKRPRVQGDLFQSILRPQDFSLFGSEALRSGAPGCWPERPDVGDYHHMPSYSRSPFTPRYGLLNCSFIIS